MIGFTKSSGVRCGVYLSLPSVTAVGVGLAVPVCSGLLCSADEMVSRMILSRESAGVVFVPAGVRSAEIVSADTDSVALPEVVPYRPAGISCEVAATPAGLAEVPYLPSWRSTVPVVVPEGLLDP